MHMLFSFNRYSKYVFVYSEEKKVESPDKITVEQAKERKSEEKNRANIQKKCEH